MRNHKDSYNSLKNRIRNLKEDRGVHETRIIDELSKLNVIAQKPGTYLKRVTKDLATDKDFRLNLLKLGLNLGTNYLYKVLTQAENAQPLLARIGEKLGLKNETNNGDSIVDLLNQLLLKLGAREKKQ